MFRELDLFDAKRLAERIQLLGAVSIAMAHDVAETTLIPRPPKGREEVPVQSSRLLHAHEIVIEECRSMARLAAKAGDDATRQTRVTLADSGLASWVVVSEPIPGSAAAAIGPRTAALLRDGPPVSLETNLGYLFMTPEPRVTPDRLPEFLDFATAVARALGTDAHIS